MQIDELNYRSFLASAMTDYLDYLDNLGFSIRGPAYTLRRIDGFLAERNIGCIQQCDSRFWIELLAQHQDRLNASTFRIWRSTFQKLCRYLVRQGWMTENPVAIFPIPKPRPYRPYVFSSDELRRFFDYLHQQEAHSNTPTTSFRFRSRYVLYHLLYACGLRVSEGIRLAVEDYSAGQHTLFIQPSKFLKDRLIPIGSRVAANLEHLLELRKDLFGIPPEGLFFPTLPTRKPYNSNTVSDYFKSVMEHLGIYRPQSTYQGCTQGTPHLHELRRAFAVHRLMRWYREQVDVDAKLPLLATYMGHSNFAYTKTYLTLTQQLLSEAGHRFAHSFDHLDWLSHDSKL
jgi:site-specific recombinase XerD